MKTTIKEITPQWASQILETRNPRNRPMSENFVEKLARDIKSGCWMLTHQGIAFDENGDLLDGQHRLAAIVKAGIAVTAYVTTGIVASRRVNGITLNAFETIDVGRQRTVSQMLTMAGVLNAANVASAIRAAVNFAITRKDWLALSSAQTHRALGFFGGSMERCTAIASAGKILRPKSTCVGVMAIIHTAKPEAAESFLQEVGDVTGPVKSHSRMLSSWLTTHRLNNYAAATATSAATATAFWNHCNERASQRLYPNDDAKKWVLSLNPTIVKNLRSLIAL